MGKLQDNEKGFSVVEIVLVVVVIALIGTVGWLIYKNHHKTTTTAITTTSSTKPATSTSTKTTTPTTTNPYAGWKTGTLQYEQISYMYPPNWVLSGSSMSPSQQNVQSDDGLIFYPGEDDYTLKTPNGNQVQLIAGLGSGFIPYQIFGSGLTLQLLGGSYYINFGTYNSGELPSGSLPSEACVGSTSSTNGNANSYILSKYITYKDPTDSPPTSGSGSDGFCYIPKNSESVTAFESDSDFTTAKLVFESMKY